MTGVALSNKRGSHNRSIVPVRYTRLAFMGALLAILAVFSTTVLCTWHCAAFHDDDVPAAVVAMQQASPASGHDLPESPIHIAAHIACQGYVAPAALLTGAFASLVDLVWPHDLGLMLVGIEGLTLLRPPRA